MEKLLERLVNAESISGYESAIRDVLAKELKPHVDEIRTDRLGNVIARKGKGSPKIMLVAHMDELGMIVKHIDKKGFLLFELVGGWDDRIIPGMKVRVHGSKKALTGVIGIKPPHLLEKEEAKSPVKAKDLMIDIGAKSDKEVAVAGVSVGDFVTRHGGFEKLLGSRVTGSGFDNRIGCAVMTEVARRIKSFKGTLYFVGTIQEELGLIGARGSIHGINPDVVLGFDVTMAGDAPDIKPSECSNELGKGPVFPVKDGVSVSSAGVRKWVTETAKKARIPLQLEVSSAGATDSSISVLVRDGIPSGSIMVATRYVHSPVEVADMKDIENAVRLGIECVKSVPRYFK